MNGKWFLVLLILLMPLASAWWNDSWDYRQPLMLKEGQGTERYQEPLTINVSSLRLATSNCSKELRVTADYSTETAIPWEIINSTGQTAANGSQWCMIQFLVNMSAAKNASYTIKNVTNYYVYYGNAGAVSAGYGQMNGWLANQSYSGDVHPNTENWRNTSVVESCNSYYTYVNAENNIANFNDTGLVSPWICSFQQWYGAAQPNYNENSTSEIRMRVLSANGAGSGGVYAGVGMTYKNGGSNQYQGGANDTDAGVGDLGNLVGIHNNRYTSATTNQFHVYRVVADLDSNYTAFWDNGVHKFTISNMTIHGDLNDSSFGENSLNYGDQINFEIDYVAYLINGSLAPPLQSTFGSEQENGLANEGIASSTSAGSLYFSNQRKLEYNAIDGSWWGAGVVNNSCYVFYSTNLGFDWTLLNASNGDTDQSCALTIDDYGNVWSYWNNATNVLSRVYGWNGVGYNVGTAFNVTDGDVGSYYGDFSMKACGDTIGILYPNAGFKKCLNIQNGGCNTTSTSWNSTNNTLTDYFSAFTGASRRKPNLDCFSNDFVGSASLSTNVIQFAYGLNQGNGDYLWSRFNFPDAYTFLTQASLSHNSTALMLAVPTASEVYYHECSSGSGCNASSNWSSSLLLSRSDSYANGGYGVSLGVVNDAPVVLWNDPSFNTTYPVLAGRWFNSTSGSWGSILPYVALNASNLSYVQVMPSYSVSTNYPVLFWDSTHSTIKVSAIDLSLSNQINVFAFDEQTGNPITFNADVYNSTALQEYSNVGFIWGANSVFPQGDVRFDITNSSYYGRSRLLWINSSTAETLNVYLINASAADVIAVTFHIRTRAGTIISNATIKIERNIGGDIVTVSELKSDFNGDGLFYLEVGAPYYLTVSHPDFDSFFGGVNPSSSSYTIYLDSASGFTGNFTTYGLTTLDDVYWYLSPFTRSLWQELTNITFFVESTSHNLTYWGMNISNCTNSSLFFVNNTVSSSGGKLYYVLNISDFNASCRNATVSFWFSHSPLFDGLTTYFANWIISSYPHSLIEVRSTLYASGVSNTGLALVVLFITMFIVAWISRFNSVIGVIVALILLSFFSFSGLFDYKWFVLAALASASLLYLRDRI